MSGETSDDDIVKLPNVSQMLAGAAVAPVEDTQQCCGTCFFGRPHGADLQAVSCRHDPPKMFMVPQPRGFSFMTDYPTTKRDSWCGQWAPKRQS